MIRLCESDKIDAMSKETILVVDNEEAVLERQRYNLDKNGCTLTVVTVDSQPGSVSPFTIGLTISAAETDSTN